MSDEHKFYLDLNLDGFMPKRIIKIKDFFWCVAEKYGFSVTSETKKLFNLIGSGASDSYLQSVFDYYGIENTEEEKNHRIRIYEAATPYSGPRFPDNELRW
jgi:hypothetical protein